jgi:hypothetical protein
MLHSTCYEIYKLYMQKNLILTDHSQQCYGTWDADLRTTQRLHELSSRENSAPGEQAVAFNITTKYGNKALRFFNS